MKNIFLTFFSMALLMITGCNDNDRNHHDVKENSTALLIIDVQNDYFPGGAMELVGANEAGEKTKLLLEYYRKNNLPIIHIQHIATNAGATFFLPNTPGAEINALVTPLEGEKVIAKHYPNSFRETDLLQYLNSKNIKKLVITGMMTDVCVDATTRAAMDFGFDNTVVGDAVATRDRELFGETVKAADVNESFLAGLTALDNLYAKVLTTKELLK
ncbi:cysteine hydrolase family protein [Chryseobacterium polytrichastri]|uniref:Nicotinamidase-related amidase n=1 Tax=Chryseobacterium polytrichastri TaxID=1302687 RepID=A0A1M6PMZ4_9FLAO|nr:cysteine hydrolase family protein [Chryseobacterium polytrichastri]SHK09325.1 Nicotinamidase-related amidase [Chryseobacterium polytrichastri]